MKNAIVMIALALASTTLALVACSDDSATDSNNNPFTPATSSGADGTSGSGGTSSGGTSSGGTSSGQSGACGQPVGCFCGTPVTQADFLNRCTKAAALPVDLKVTPATTANVP